VTYLFLRYLSWGNGVCDVYGLSSVSEAMNAETSNHSLEPTTGRRDAHIYFMKEAFVFAKRVFASGGSAPSR